MNKQLYIIRGIPGSGKSTLAKQLRDGFVLAGISIGWYEADMYFYQEDNYIFDRSKLSDAHKWCLESVQQSLINHQITIVSNTFTTKEEVKPYLETAIVNKINPQIIICQSKFKSIHAVPEEALQRMRNRFCVDI